MKWLEGKSVCAHFSQAAIPDHYIFQGICDKTLNGNKQLHK